MTSKKLKPLSSLLQQWSGQTDPERSSYKILLQSSHSLHTRVQAAETVENPQLYQRAGVRTPAETAVRDILGGQAWLQHFSELGRKANCHVVFIRTTTQSSSKESSSSSTVPPQMTIIDASNNNPWGWDDEDEQEGPSLKDLQKLSLAIRDVLQTHKQVMLVWESLTPLVVVHGFSLALRFLNSFRNCLQIWPVRIEILTTQQHAQLEDAAQALLYLRGGEMTMIRQGIRETGNIVRETLPFQLVSDGNNNYRLEEREDDAPVAEKDQETAESKATNPTTTVQETTTTATTSGNPMSRPKIQLKLEEEKEENTSAPSNRPRIFLQDDDPEFDDLDEEDPDEDLDMI
jgi:hypothetical protein